MNKYSDHITFLGTAGARFVMINQTRHSGGLWLSYRGTNVLIDPGPGSLVRCLAHKQPRLDPGRLDGIILTHRHLDHCNDINVMIEAMTQGGYVKRGTVFCPADACGQDDSVIYRYVREYPERIVILEPLSEYMVGEVRFHTSMPHRHPAQTYGLKFDLEGIKVGLLVDTAYFDDLADFYSGLDILIMGVLLPDFKPSIYHLSIPEVLQLSRLCKPSKLILTHFGRQMLASDPSKKAKGLARELGIPVIAAKDGMVVRI